jgi:predicted ATP-dependent protease
MLIGDVLREAAHYSHQEGAATLSRKHVVQAIEERYLRSNLIQDKLNEMIKEKQILLDHTGSKVGQVNGLSVIDLGDISFGRPNRITCTVNVGKGGIITIEREAELSGPLHTKGVLILSGYLGEKFFQDKPLSLSARLVFEQSYGEIEGDSASSTELYALLSSLSGVPIKQGIAVTGSVNQKGEVQAIGGVNEKIEGYFEICQILGLTGDQGVIIPRANLRNLMLKASVREAVEKNQFSIWAIDHVEEGIEILTGLKAGTIHTADTLLYKANQTLQGFSQKMLAYEDGEEMPIKSQKSSAWTTDIVLE